MSRGDHARLEDILEAIAAVRRYHDSLEVGEPLTGAVRDAIY